MKIELGDRITFRAATRWGGFKKATRKVNGFYMLKPTVRFGGYKDFIVRHYEILKVEGKEL